MRLLVAATLLSSVFLTASAVGEASAANSQVPSWQSSSARLQPHTARRAGSCRRLRGRDLAPARRVKVVRRRNPYRGTDLLGCVLPRGRVHTIASSENADTTVSTYKLRQVSGAIVLVAFSYSSQYAAASGTSVWNLRGGRSYQIAEHCLSILPVCRPNEDAVATAAFINRRGQAAAAIVRRASNATEIVGFSSRGERRALDFGPSEEVPATSLGLTGSVVSWMRSGVTRSATLAG